MSDIIRRAAINIVSSKAFLDTFSNLLTTEIERQLRAEAGGDRLYIAKTCDSAEKCDRDSLIKSEFTGNNLAQLAKKHNLSHRQIRRICKK